MKRLALYSRFHAVFRLVMAMAVLYCPAALAKVTDIHVEKSRNNVVLFIRGNETLQYKLSEFNDPDRLLLTVFDQALAVNKDQLSINQGQVDKVMLKQEGEHVRLSIALRAKTQYNVFAKDGNRTIVLSMRTDDFALDSTPSKAGETETGVGEAKAGSATPPLPGGKNLPAPGYAYKDFKGGGPPPLPGYGFDKLGGAQNGEGYLGGGFSANAKGVDTSPILEHIVFQDATIGDVAIQLSRITGLNILVDAALSGNISGTAGGTSSNFNFQSITIDLKNITLEQALDVITKGNGITWFKIADTYILASSETKLLGLETVSNGIAYEESSLPVDIRVIPVKHAEVTVLSGYLNTVMGEPPDAESPNILTDPLRNILILRGPVHQLEKAEKLVAKLDTPAFNNNVVFKMVALPDDLIKYNPDLSEIITNFIAGSALLGVSGQVPFDSRINSGATAYDLQYLSVARAVVYIGPQAAWDKIKPILDQFIQSQARFRMWRFTLQNLPASALVIGDLALALRDGGSAASPGESEENRGSSVYVDNGNNAVFFFGPKNEADRLKEFLERLDTAESKPATAVVKLKNMNTFELISGNADGCPGLFDCALATPFYGYPEYNGERRGPGNLPANFTDNPTIAVLQHDANAILLTGPQLFVNRIKDFIIAMDAEAKSDSGMEMIQLQYILAVDAVSKMRGMMEMNGDPTATGSGSGGLFGGDATQTIRLEERGYINFKTNTSGEDSTLNRTRLWYTVDVPRNAILLKGIPKAIQEARRIINIFDKPAPMVKIDVKVLQILESDAKQLGWNIQGSKGDLILQAPGANALAGSALAGLIEGADITNAVQFDGRGSKNKSRLLANPNILVTNLTPTTLDFHDRVPFQDGNNINADTEVGITLDITPIINNGDEITLQVRPTVDLLNSLFSGRTCSDAETRPDGSIIPGQCFDTQFPVTSTRTLFTEARVKNNTPLIIGGMISSRDIKEEFKVPFLGDLPLLGAFFRRKHTTEEDLEVVIVITPTIQIQEAAEPAAATGAGG